MISKCRKLPKVVGKGKVGRLPKSWKEVLKNYFSVRGVSPSWVRTVIGGVLPAKQTPL